MKSYLNSKRMYWCYNSLIFISWKDCSILISPRRCAKPPYIISDNKQHGTLLTFWYANCQTFFKSLALMRIMLVPLTTDYLFFTHPFFIFCIKTALFAFFSFTNSSLKIHAISPKIMLDTLTSFDESLHVWLEPFFGKIHD